MNTALFPSMQHGSSGKMVFQWIFFGSDESPPVIRLLSGIPPSQGNPSLFGLGEDQDYAASLFDLAGHRLDHPTFPPFEGRC
jgi:hypothetical protein